MGKEGVEGVHAVAQPALDVIDRMDQARIHLDLAPPDHPHRARIADPALVVAVDVGTHGQLRLVLLGVQELQDLLGIGDGVVAALDRAGDRAGLDPAAVDPHEHLRRGADQELVRPEIDEEGIGRRVHRLEPARDFRRPVFGTLVEDLPGHDLEEIAAHELLLGGAHEVGIFARLVVAARRDPVRGREGRIRPAAFQTFRRGAVHGEVVAGPECRGRIVIDLEQLVGQVQHQIAARGIALQHFRHRLELIGEIVAEGAVEAELAPLLGAEQRHDGPQHGKDARHARTLFLGHRRGRLDDGQVDDVVATRAARDVVIAGQRRVDEAEQHTAARVQRLDAHVAPGRRDDQRRIDEGDVLARVAAGIFVVGEQDRPAARVEPVEIGLDRALIRHGLPAAGDGDASGGHIPFPSVFGLFGHHESSPGLATSSLRVSCPDPRRHSKKAAG